MPAIQRIDEFRICPKLRADHARLIEAVRSGTFGDVMRQAVQSHTSGVTRFYLYEAKSGAESRLHHHACEPGVTDLFPVYEAYYRRFDPVCEAYNAAHHVGDMVIQRVRPADVSSREFRQRFFDEAGIVERVSIVQRGQGQWYAMNLARHRSEGCFGDIELDHVLGLANLALPMLAFQPDLCVASASHEVNQLENRFETMFPQLSLRERQVCARAAKGMSVEATALDLAIGKASVLTYRRRAYRRLAVSSPFELSALVLH